MTVVFPARKRLTEKPVGLALLSPRPVPRCGRPARRPAPSARRVADAEDRPPLLSPREVEVLAAIGAGATTRSAAAALQISPKTVEHHKQRIFSKLDVQNQAHAVAVAIRLGLVAPALVRREG